MRIIRKKQIKFLKLFLLSPLLDQANHIAYIISIIILYYQLLFIPANFSNYIVGEQLSEIFKERNFREINSFEEFSNYFNKTIYKLYDINKFPIFLPIGSLRLKTYDIKNQCTKVSDKCYTEKTGNKN